MIPFNEKVKLIRNGEPVGEFDAHVLDGRQISLRPNQDVVDGDIVERTNPAGLLQRFRVVQVDFNNSPFREGLGNQGHLDHTLLKVKLADTLPLTPKPVKPLTIEGLHNAISKAAGSRFAAGQYADAVSAAFKAVEARVKALSPHDLSGKRLMGQTFGTASPHLDVTTAREPRSIQDEREGFNQLFMGSFQGIRDPRAHEEMADTAEEAMEYLGLASLLMRRLDIAEKKR
ncbi:hypothetical protein AD006_25325 [Pseudonocardia sp. EC080610-09]|uniref:TIGR02391 family protein n=1 Tax=unclassified Pseudonocardia TaxID=2619320 RepID=UPI0006CB5C90|nr:MULTISPECIES: TIGR02391 family protein [unclassified Pseudonocardia]ALE74388.1 hypothetical protein FRP1_17880 [Pseudonocardia sp. EC080625-04]ALL77797.1 hypothetical protein AD006_25325 [Pseudonocardia sp. EC080610-09]ALL80713.1 hypothetical protein AD017_04915 [Pseudonocardia sp. EC080619-01]